MEKIAKLILIALFFLSVSQIHAVPAYPYPKKVKQPDGTTLTVILRGDEFHKYHITEDGHLITKDNKGVFNYAVLDADGKILNTGVKAKDLSLRSKTERSFIENLSRTHSVAQTFRQMWVKRASSRQMKLPTKFPTAGSPRSLVILVNFSDLNFVIPNPVSAFHDMLNQEGYSANDATGSARDYFRDNSMKVFSPQFDVVGPFTLPQPFAFYGENDADGYDKNSVQMVVDACTLASEAGVDFSIYDTDGDNIVDNVFIYYAGYNEAEWADENTIWPHKWAVYPKTMYPGSWNYSGTTESVTFNGKRVVSYACTSELRGNTGAEMCGIGTFTHEFGHVIGLADMYPTNEYEHFTLSYWNIMDSGVYLNEGRTPPGLNAFERFQLGFLTPELLAGENVGKNLEPLISNNQAYLISASDYHNLNGADPDPAEFFLLENRQKISWDAFLPGHGMLIYRINYNAYDWNYNQPNNNPNKMGVQLMPADGKANDGTLSGDPFPGTSNVTSFDFISRTGTPFNKGVRGVVENDGNITFSILTPLGVPIVPADAGTINVSSTGFNAVWSSVAGANSYLIDVYTKTPGGGSQIVLSENFSKFTAGQPNGSADGVDISNNLNNYVSVSGWYGNNVFQAGGSVKVGDSASLGYLALPALDLSAADGKFKLKFDAMAWNGDSRLLKIYINGQVMHTVSDLNNTTYTFNSYSIPFVGGATSTIVRFEGNKASKGRFFLDNVEIIQEAESLRVPVSLSPFSASGLSCQIENLEAEQSYYYTVKAVNDAQESSPSLEVGPISLIQSGSGEVVLRKLKIWSVDKVLFFEAEENENVEVFNLSGQKICTLKSTAGINQIPMQISGVVIVKVADRIGKVIL